MDFFDIVTGITLLVLVVGLIGTLVRNGRSQTAKFTEVKVLVRGIKEDLDSPEKGLDCINKKIGEVVTKTAVLTERISGHDREIRDLKTARPRTPP